MLTLIESTTAVTLNPTDLKITYLHLNSIIET